MQVLKIFLLFFIIFTVPIINGCGKCNNCCDHCGESYPEGFYFLVNNLNEAVHYESYYGNTLLFNTILYSKDTLFLYSRKFTPPEENINDPSYWLSSDVIIKDGYENLLFYRSKDINCGKAEFLSEKINDDNYYHYWTIDSEYIADKSCMTTYD